MTGLELDPASIVTAGDLWTVAVNRNQNLLGKTMLVLARDCEDVRALTPDEWVALHADVRRVTAALDALFQPDHYNYAFLMNADAHVHLHVLPRYAEPRNWDGAEFTDARFGQGAGDSVRQLTPDRLGKLAEAIRERLAEEVG